MAIEDLTLEQRVWRLEQLQEIEQVKYRYLRAVDGKNFEEFRECFVTEGASLDYGAFGYFTSVDELLEAFNAYFLSKEGDSYLVLDMHHAVHPQLEVVSATEAVGQWTLRFREINTRDGIELINCGTYDDRYVKVDGRWRIQQQHFSILWMLIQPLPDGATVLQPGWDTP